MEEEAREQLENSKVPKQLQPYQYKKGQSGNPKGRPEGISMKEYIRRNFRHMTDDEREEFLEGINKLDILKMAEGNPKQDVGGGEDENGKPIPILVQFVNAEDNKHTS